jgi:hypothetical protein
MNGKGLTKLTSDHLRTLYRHVYRGTLSCPFQRKDLLSMGLNPQAEEGEVLFDLDEKAVRAVILSVLAERERF